MQIFRDIVLTACVIGVVDKVIGIICGKSYSSQLRLITALVMILCIGSQIKGGINIPDISYYEEELEEAEEITREQYLDSIEDSLSERIRQIYLQKGIALENVSIALSFNEYKYISVDEIMLFCNDREITDNELKEVIAGYLPDVMINIVR
ncbi:MAG: hypothetical protein IKR76_08265 [Ruminococcus sp.]|nr:hypothetical protein [Ruminococcus sp.]